MKKIRLYLPVLMFLSLITIPVSVIAADLSLGLTSWYSMWDEKMEAEGEPKITQNPDNTFMAGPILGLRFYDRWKLGLQFYVGKMTDDSTQTETDGSDTEKKDVRSKYTRYDSDLTLGYQWFPWLTTFAGYKFSGYNVDDSFTYHVNGVFDGTKDQEGTKKIHGFGIGAGTSFNIYEGIYFSLNGSWIYIIGSYPTESKSYDTGGNLTDSNEYHYDIDGWGINGTTALSYYFSSASTTLSLGFRYQYYKYDMESENLVKIKDKFYGFTLAAIYNIPDL